MKNPHTPNLTWIWFTGGPRYDSHEYLISPIESVWHWPEIHTLFGTMWSQFTLISLGLIRYSCGHISGPHELSSHPIWSCGCFSSCSTRYMVSKTFWNPYKKFCDVIASVLYWWSIRLLHLQFIHPQCRGYHKERSSTGGVWFYKLISPLDTSTGAVKSLYTLCDMLEPILPICCTKLEGV